MAQVLLFLVVSLYMQNGVLVQADNDSNVVEDVAQNGKLLHVGRTFAFAFPHTRWDAEKCEFVVTAWNDANVHVEADGVNLNVTDKVAVGTSKRYQVNCLYMLAEEGVENKAILVASDADIQVEVVTLYKQLGASFLLLPVTEDSTQFVAGAFYDRFSMDSYTRIIVVPTESDTQVTLYRRESNTYIYEESVSVAKYQTFSLRQNSEDLTGMYLVASKPVAVISGSALTAGIPDKTNTYLNGYIYTAIPPVSKLGYRHIILPQDGRAETTGYYVQVLAAHDNTAVILSQGVTTEVLERGRSKMVFMNSQKPTTVKCSEPCLVLVYSKTNGADTELGTDGMAMMTVPSNSQAVQSAYFNTFKTNNNAEFINHVSMLSTVDGFGSPEYMLDGQPLDVQWTCVNNGFSCDYVYTSFTVKHGTHSIKPKDVESNSNITFLAWTYSNWGTSSTHGTIIGMSEVNKEEELSTKHQHQACFSELLSPCHDEKSQIEDTLQNLEAKAHRIDVIDQSIKLIDDKVEGIQMTVKKIEDTMEQLLQNMKK